MSSVSSLTISSNVSVYTPTTTQVSGATDRDGDGDGQRGHRGHRGGHGGGGMDKELMAAFQSLGLTPTASASASSGSKASGSDASASSDQYQSSDGVSRSTLRKDMHEFMHQLFEAARQAESGGAAEPGKGRFAQGLSALLSEVSAGNTPSGLQGAFDKLKSDLGVSSGATGDATLQALLSKLQGNLGYGGTSAGSTTAGVGTTLSTVA
jgi:hypothetical protein